MEFNLSDALPILERTPKVVAMLLENLPQGWIYQNEGGDTWSAFDVIGHYIQGEKTDWISRMNIILQSNDKQFQPFDRFAQFRDSKGKSLGALLLEFAALRKENIRKLNDAKLSNADLDKKGIHPKFGEVSLRQLLSTWVVHDLTHISQISRVMAKQYEREVGPWKEYLGILNR